MKLDKLRYGELRTLMNPFPLIQYRGIRGVAIVKMRDGRIMVLPLALATFLRDKGRATILVTGSSVDDVVAKVIRGEVEVPKEAKERAEVLRRLGYGKV